MDPNQTNTQNTQFIQSLLGAGGTSEIGAKIRSQYPGQVGPGISDDILGAALLNRFPALSPYNALNSGLNATSTALGVQKQSATLPYDIQSAKLGAQKTAQELIDPTTGMSAEQAGGVKAAQQTALNAKQIDDLWGYKKFSDYAPMLVSPAQRIVQIIQSKGKYPSADAYNQALTTAALQLNKQISSSFTNDPTTGKAVSIFPPDIQQELNAVNPQFQNKTQGTSPILSWMTGNKTIQSQNLIDSDQDLLRKANYIIKNYGSGQTQPKSNPLPPITTQSYSGDTIPTWKSFIEDKVVNNLPLIGGVAGGLLGSAIAGPGVGIPTGMAIDAALGGAAGAGGEALKEKIQGQKLNPNQIAGEGAVNAISMGAARPISKFVLPAIGNAAEKIPFINNIIQGIKSSGDNAFTRIFGPPTGDNLVKAKQVLKNVVERDKINAGNPSDPAILHDRMRQSANNILDQTNQWLQGKQILNDQNKPFTVGDLRQLVDKNGHPEVNQNIMTHVDRVMADKPDALTFSGRGKALRGKPVYTTTDMTPLDAADLNNIKYSVGQDADWTGKGKDLTSNNAIKRIYTKINDLIDSQVKGYKDANFEYHTVDKSADYLKQLANDTGHIKNAGFGPRFHVGPMSIPLPLSTVGMQQVGAQGSGILPKIVTRLAIGGGAEKISNGSANIKR